MELDKKIRMMNRVMLEYNFFYYSDAKNRFYFEELELTLHPSWKQHRSISDANYDLCKREYLETASQTMHVTEALNKITFDVENETQLHIVLNMCKEAKLPTAWPGKYYGEADGLYIV